MDLEDVLLDKVNLNQTHQERHIFLHKCLDELLADFIRNTGRLLSDTNLVDFLNWSHLQTKGEKNENY